MKIFSRLVSATLFTAIISTTAHATLIENGSFENIGESIAIDGYGSSSSWQIYSSLPSWEASQSMEIWTNDFIVPAYDGSNVLELNAHPASTGGIFSIHQSFETVVGQEYELFFAGRKRHANSDEAFMVSVAGLTDSIFNQAWGTWTEYSYGFTATSALSTLTFTSLDGGRDTTGNIFDAISVTSVPEPDSIALFLLGCVGLGFQRKSQNSVMK
ncbi:MAG: DUF642 domain-containing protein [Pseudomonadales bacterium]|nr:DUF642 domain-containing protein [Pseudomonadales bacterium]